jgi:hypothetical protein
MSCELNLYRSKWRAGSTIPFEIRIDRVDDVNLVGSEIVVRFIDAERIIRITKSTEAGTIVFTLQSPEALRAEGKVLPMDLPAIVGRTRIHFAVEVILPNGDEIPVTSPGQDWFDLYPEVG